MSFSMPKNRTWTRTISSVSDAARTKSISKKMVLQSYNGPYMHRILLPALAVLLTGTFAFAQNKPPATPKPAPAKAAPKTAAPPAKSALDKPTFEAYLRHQFMIPDKLQIIVGDPQPSEVPSMHLINVTVTDGGPVKQQVEFFVSKDGTKIMQGKVFDIRESPFANDLKLLKTAGVPATGPDKAPVNIIVFSDFQCQFCKEEAKTLRAHLKEYPTQVRLFFKDFPLEQIHPWAKQASLIGRCINRQSADAFWQFHDWIFEQQPTLTAETATSKSLDYANGRVDALQLKQCVDGKITEAEVNESMADGRALQVSSTPTLFINGRRLVGNVPWEQVKQIIDYEIDYKAKHPEVHKADEACCEVKLAIPVK